MKLAIPEFPNAEYEASERRGFLCFYYPSGAVKGKALDPEIWRGKSYSPEILDYKEGKAYAFEFFAPPFLNLLDFVLKTEKSQQASLIPVPSSIQWDDSRFSRKPRAKTDPSPRNRDDRNSVFCNLLSSRNSRLKTLDILLRQSGKQEKETWTADRHAKSLSVQVQAAPKFNPKTQLFVLVDDVSTKGGTLEGAKKAILTQFPNTTVVSLSLAQSKDPSSFQPLS